MKLTDALLAFVSKCWGPQDAHVHSSRAVQTESCYGYPRPPTRNWEIGRFRVSDSSAWTQEMLGCQLERTGYAILKG